MAAKGTALKGALASAPRGGRVTSLPVGKPPAPTAGLQRLSPGVYRNQQGNLVNSSGGALPGQRPQQRPQPQQQPQPPFQAMPGQQPQQPTFRPPAPLPQDGQAMYYTGGTPNFNELTGMYNQPASMQFPMQNENFNYFQNGFGQGIAGLGKGPAMLQNQQFSDNQQQLQQQQQTMMPQSPFYRGNI